MIIDLSVRARTYILWNKASEKNPYNLGIRYKNHEPRMKKTDKGQKH